MATLHILSHSPFADSRLASCLRLLGTADGLLLSGDAVYALQPGTTNLQAPERAQVVDYPGFVELCTRYAKVNSWL